VTRSIRDLTAHRVRNNLERPSKPGPLAGRQRQCVVLALVRERCIALPYVATYLDDLAGSTERIVIGHTMKALNDLGAGSAEPQVKTAVAERVDTRRGHGNERGRTGIDGQMAAPISTLLVMAAR